MRKQVLWLIIAGSVLNVFGLLSQRFFDASDLVKGLIQGIGIGILLLAMIRIRQYKIRCNN